MSYNEKAELHTNMTDGQIFEHLQEFISACQCCRVAHHECRRVPECHECETGFWIRQFSDYLGIKLTVG